MLPLSVLIIIIMIVITAETSMICASPYQAISMNGMDSTELVKRMCHRTAYMHISIYTYIYIYAHVHMSGGVYKGAFYAEDACKMASRRYGSFFLARQSSLAVPRSSALVRSPLVSVLVCPR